MEPPLLNHGNDPGEAPRHGFRGDAPTPGPEVPAGLTIAVSREAGARGATIARRVGRRLGWQVYDQELLDYLAQESQVRQEAAEGLSQEAAAWVEARLEALLREQNVSQHPSVISLARVELELAARGQAVLIGRGAGHLLPRATTLHVRVVAPLHDRVAYVAQWLRLTTEEAVEKVRLRDQRRAEFVTTHFHRDPAEIYQYDMVLNSSQLSEEVCAELIVQAAQARSASDE